MHSNEEESIHYKRKTGRAFARTNALFLERRNGRMRERARAARENTGFARARVLPRRLLHHHRRRGYLYYVKKRDECV